MLGMGWGGTGLKGGADMELSSTWGVSSAQCLQGFDRGGALVVPLLELLGRGRRRADERGRERESA